MKNNRDGKWMYSLRKSTKYGMVSVATGFMGIMLTPQVEAHEQCQSNAVISYNYVTTNEITDEEKSQIISALPENVTENATYYLVYRPVEAKTLPSTGTTTSGVASLIGAGLLVAAVAVSKRKKRTLIYMGVLLPLLEGGFVAQEVSAVNIATFSHLSTTTELRVGDKLPNGIVNIDGYEFVGYLKGEHSAVKTNCVKEEKQVIETVTEEYPQQPIVDQKPTPTPEPTSTPQPEEPVKPEQPTVVMSEDKEQTKGEIKTSVIDKKEETHIEQDYRVMPADVQQSKGEKTVTEEVISTMLDEKGNTIEKVKETTVTPIIPGVNYISDPTRSLGEQVVVYPGQEGRIVETAIVDKVNGVETNRVNQSIKEEPAIDKVVKVGTKVEAVRTVEIIEETTEILPGVDNVANKELEIGQTRKTAGEKGYIKVKYEVVKDENGREISRKVISREEKAARNTVVEHGAKEAKVEEKFYQGDKDVRLIGESYDHNKTITEPTSTKQAYKVGDEVPVHFEFANSTDKDQKITTSVEVYYGEKQVGKTLDKTLLLRKGDAVKVDGDSELQKDFTIPADWLENNKGYRVKVAVKDQEGNILDYKIMGLAVEDDWRKFPRYAAIAGSQDVNNSFTDDPKVLAKFDKEYKQLKNMHINAHFYYDVYKDPTDPLPEGEKIMPQRWNWWTNSTVDQDVLRKLVAKTHEDGAQAMLYNMISARSNFDKPIPVGEEDLVYNYEDNFFGEKGTPMRNPMLRVGDDLKVYQEYYDPSSPKWQEYIAKVMKDAMERFNFDGWQGDTIGDARVTSYENRDTDDKDKSFLMSDTYVNFTNKMKELIPNKHFTVNAVGGQGLKDLAASNQDMVYAEIWANGDRDDNKTGTGRFHTEYGDLKRLVDQVRDISGKSLVVAAYIELPGDSNGSKNDTYFQTDAALLVDATVAAAGGYHMTAVANANSKHEYGVGIIDAAYYSSQGLKVSEELNRKLYNYQQFITAYENFLRGEGVTNNPTIASTFDKDGKQLSYDDGHNPDKSGVYGNQVWTFTKTAPDFNTIQLINLKGINTGWVNTGGMSDNKTPEPQENLKVLYPLYNFTKVQAEAQAEKVYVASPDDWAKGDMTKVAARVKEVAPDRYVLEIDIPKLTLWDMIYMPKVAEVSSLDPKQSGVIKLKNDERIIKDAGTGDYARGRFIESNGSWYYADQNGYLATGRTNVNGQDLVFDEDGRQVKGEFSKLPDGKLVYTDPTSGEVKKDGFFEKDGAWYYANNESIILTGEQIIAGQNYYFRLDGRQVKGELVYLPNDKIVFADKDSGVTQEVKKGKFFESNGAWYYLDNNGTLATGRTEVNGQDLVFDETGRQVKGEFNKLTTGELVYTEADSGEVKKDGFFEKDGAWYYVDVNGKIATGRREVNDQDLVFDETGRQIKGEFTKIATGGIVFTDANSGEVKKDGFFEKDGSWYYANSNGKVLTGAQTIDGLEYYFREDGRQVKGEWVEVNGEKAYYDENTGIRKKD